MWKAVGVLQQLKTLQPELTEIARQNERHTWLNGVNAVDFLFRLQADDLGKHRYEAELHLTTRVLVFCAHNISLKLSK
jgi:hypothetical protein